MSITILNGESQWRGYRALQEPPAPLPGTPWGGPAPTMPSALAQAALEGDLAAKVQAAGQ